MDGEAFELDGGVIALCGCQGARAALSERELSLCVVPLRVKLDKSEPDTLEPGCVREDRRRPYRISELLVPGRVQTYSFF